MLETLEKATSLAQRLYAATFPQRQHIHLLADAEVHAGWEGTIFSLQLGYEEDHGEHADRVALKCYYDRAGQQKGYTEWLALRQLAHSHYPVPVAFSSSFEHFPLEQTCILMEGIEGPGMRQVFRAASQDKQIALLQEFCRLQVALHAIDWQLFVTDPEEYCADDFLASQVAKERQFAEGYFPGCFAPAFRWLTEKMVQLPGPCLALVHGDFHLGNLLLRPDGTAVVIDWTAFDIADYRSDLARTLLISHLHMSAGWASRIRETYEEISGRCLEHMEYFEVIACIDRLTNMLITLQTYDTVIGMNPETIGQHAGDIWKLLSLLQEKTGHTLPDLAQVIADVSAKCAGRQ
jgi:aminoglycoside phosphotransferase (APT) family kinase protein